jgi:hypothetical protein
VPGIGAVAYVVVELLPELLGGPHAQQARRHVANKLDPEKLYRALADRLDATDTIANRSALAAECLALGRFDEAERHYDHILKLPIGEEPLYALGKAKAQFGLNRPLDVIATLDDLQARWPEYQSAEGHLLYARALAAAGRAQDALGEFEALVAYAPSAEVRVRYGLLLDQLGRAAEAKAVFAELLVQMKRAPKYVRKVHAEWLSIAEKRLAA